MKWEEERIKKMEENGEEIRRWERMKRIEKIEKLKNPQKYKEQLDPEDKRIPKTQKAEDMARGWKVWRAVGSGSPPPQVPRPPTMQPGSPCRRGGESSAGVNLASPAFSPAREVGARNGVVEHPPEKNSHRNLKVILAPPKNIVKEGGGGEGGSNGDTPAAPNIAREIEKLPEERQNTPLEIPEKVKKVPTQVVIKGRKYSFKNSTINSYLNKSTTKTKNGTTTSARNATLGVQQPAKGDSGVTDASVGCAGGVRGGEDHGVPGGGEVDVVHIIPGSDGVQGGGEVQGQKRKGVAKDEVHIEGDLGVPGEGVVEVPGDDGVHEGGGMQGHTGNGDVKDEECSEGDHRGPGGGEFDVVHGVPGDDGEQGGGGGQGHTRESVGKDEVCSEGDHRVPGGGEVHAVHGVPGDDGVQGGGGVQVHTGKGVVKCQQNKDSGSDIDSEMKPNNRIGVLIPSPSPSPKLDIHKVRDSTPSAEKSIKKPIKGLKIRKNRLTKVQLLEEQAKKCAKMTQYLTRPALSSKSVQIDKNKRKFQFQQKEATEYTPVKEAESRLELTKPNLKQQLKAVIPVQKSDLSQQNMNNHSENIKPIFEDLGQAAW